MERTLRKIKDCIILGNYRFTEKAKDEIAADNLDYIDVLESIVNSQFINKKIRSVNPFTKKREYLYVIESYNYSGILIYTKGKLFKEEGKEIFYILISSKKARD